MWIRTINNMDNEIMINLDNIEGIAYNSNANQTILTSQANKYTIKGTPDRIFELLKQKGMVEVLPLSRKMNSEDDGINILNNNLVKNDSVKEVCK